jgi:hypothetical protein
MIRLAPASPSLADAANIQWLLSLFRVPFRGE